MIQICRLFWETYKYCKIVRYVCFFFSALCLCTACHNSTWWRTRVLSVVVIGYQKWQWSYDNKYSTLSDHLSSVYLHKLNKLVDKTLMSTYLSLALCSWCTSFLLPSLLFSWQTIMCNPATVAPSQTNQNNLFCRGIQLHTFFVHCIDVI